MTRIVRVLAIDGGGIRGIIPSVVLTKVEALLQEASKNPEARICDYFDLVAGTSTGGIITALCLCPDKPGGTRPKYTANDMVKLYQEEGKKIFTRTQKTKTMDFFGLFNPIYGKKNLEQILEERFGETYLSQLLKPCLIPAYDIEHGKSTFFNKLSVDQGLEKDVLLREAVRATSAAPTYFPVAKAPGSEATFIDGGLFANNPALCAFIEATKFPSRPMQNEIMVLSLGTGARDANYAFKMAKGWGRLGWVIPVIDIYGSASSQTVDHQLQKLYEQEELEHNYLRIEPNLKEFNVARGMDDASPKNIKALYEVGLEMTRRYEQELRDFIHKVVKSHGEFSHELLYRKRPGRAYRKNRSHP